MASEQREAATVLAFDPGPGAGVLRLAGGRTEPFARRQCTGFEPVAGLAVEVERGTDGEIRRVTLAAHPTKPSAPAHPFGTAAVVLLDAPLPLDVAALRGLCTLPAAGVPRLAVARRTEDAAIELVWPDVHMLAVAAEVPYPTEGVDARLVTAEALEAPAHVALTPSVLELASGRRAGEGAFPDPWGTGGVLRLASELLARWLSEAGGRALVLPRAGGLVLGRDDALRRFGKLEDAACRPFGAWVDWALTPDRRAYRSLGMAVLGGEDVEIAVEKPEAEVELDSAESAVLFACMLQVRENRFLRDGEVFYVPKDVRVGSYGASALSKTGYKYIAHAGHERVQLIRG